MTVDLWMPYMSVLILRTLTLMEGYSGSAKAKNQNCMLSATEQAKTIKLTTMVGHYVTLLRDLDLEFANIYMARRSCYVFFFYT